MRLSRSTSSSSPVALVTKSIARTTHRDRVGRDRRAPDRGDPRIAQQTRRTDRAGRARRSCRARPAGWCTHTAPASRRSRDRSRRRSSTRNRARSRRTCSDETGGATVHAIPRRWCNRRRRREDDAASARRRAATLVGAERPVRRTAGCRGAAGSGSCRAPKRMRATTSAATANSDDGREERHHDVMGHDLIEVARRRCAGERTRRQIHHDQSRDECGGGERTAGA